MYFNIDKELCDEYKEDFPDLLEKPAIIFNEFDDNFEDKNRILLVLNPNLKQFPIIDHWRKELFYQWDICRQSLICATSIVKEFCVNFKEDEISEARIYYEQLAEYYLDNISFRVFSILEKLGHPLNILLDLGFTHRKVSYFNVKTKLINDYAEHYITKIFEEFEKDKDTSKMFKEYRNSLTHRDHLLQPTYGLADIELDMGEENENGLNGIISANISTSEMPELDIIKLYDVVLKFYGRLTLFLEDVFLASLDEIIERYEKEVEFDTPRN